MFDNGPTPEKRSELHRLSAEYMLRLKMEEDFWKQKEAVRWVAEGERSTKFFQGWVKQKKVKARIHRIVDNGRVLEEEADIRNSAAEFFRNLLTSDVEHLEVPEFDDLSRIPDSVDLDGLYRIPEEAEVRKAVFGIDGFSCAGPDGFSSLFFQKCWEVVKLDVIAAVVEFFKGA